MEVLKHTPVHTSNPNDLPPQGNTQIPPPPPSSPSHEFSFAISLNSSNTIKSISAAAFDFSPADDIFFHGHLLPLHLLSQPAISPRTSTDICIENFSLPLNYNYRNLSSNSYDNDHTASIDGDHLYHEFNFTNNKERLKKQTSLSSTIFSFAKQKKLTHENNVGEHNKGEDKRPRRRKGLDMKRFIKKYMSLMDTIFPFRSSSQKSKRDIRQRPCSFSGHSNRSEWGGFTPRSQDKFSAPATMRTSPMNSGLLSPTSTVHDQSTMEELQSAIQAAIAHCKNSSSVK